MAEIDKGLPNTRKQEEIPSEAELQEVAVQEQAEQDPKGPIEVIPEEDGGVTLAFEPGFSYASIANLEAGLILALKSNNFACLLSSNLGEN